MSVDISNINYPVKENLKTKIVVPEKHFLITLSESIPWSDFSDIAIHDLYRDRRRSGRKLNLRLHIGAFILQTLFRWTDRELEENLNFYAPARVFCGISDREKSYDHSSYVKFRNRLSDETAKQFNTSILKVAVKKGFTGSQFLDFDSTVQEANIEYPSDMRMMQSLVRKSNKILSCLAEAGSYKANDLLKKIEWKKLSKKFKSYYFAKKSKNGFELKQKLFQYMEKKTSQVLKHIKDMSGVIKEYELPWNIKRDLFHCSKVGPALLRQIRYFIKYREVAPNKILSLHAKEVKCISKGKVGTPYEFGRTTFVGRLPGNYTQVFTGKEVALVDAKSMEQELAEYFEIFDSPPKSISGDQGFWSKENLNACKSVGIEEIGICPRGHKNWLIPDEKVEEICNRRSIVEALIGQLKKRGLGKSKMKSDEMTKLDGQRSSLSLNLSRLARDLSDRPLKWAG
jgi:hypothetical protein